MTVPAPIHTVTCQVCRTEVYAADDPPTDGQALLTGFADASCPRGGVGCPNTTTAVQQAAEERPPELRRLIRAARARLPRTRRLPVPALT
ncbi:MAG: hypothetical protein ACRD0V_17710, partial [Acidimicrobiales bacterium]